MATTQLTEHFTLAEFTASSTAHKRDIDNTPNADALDELHDLAETMEEVRKLLGDHPVQITSGFRCPQLNAAVGGVPDSAHVFGRACDFLAPAFGTPREICRKLWPHIVDLGIDQLIHECGTDSPGDEWVHLGLAAENVTPRCQALTISTAGTETGFV